MDTLDFNNATFDDLDQYAMEKLVFDTGELSSILKGHLFIERVLETLIANNVPNPNALFKRRRLSFDLKIDLASSLGLISQNYVSAFKAINNVRNKYAHKDSYKVTLEELSGFKFDWDEQQNRAFKLAYENKGVEEAAQIATIFLCWNAIHLIKDIEA